MSETSLLRRVLSNLLPAKGVKAHSPYVVGGNDFSSFVTTGSSRVTVNEQTARSVSAVVACTNLIGGTLASMPLHFYRQGKDSREKYSPPEWWIFNERFHPRWSAAAAWQFLSDSRLLYGDGFAVIHRASKYDPRIVSIEPWHPLLVDVKRQDGRLKYRFTPPTDRIGESEIIVLDQDDVLHIAGSGFNGIRGISQLQYGLRNAAGIAQAADDQSLTWFGNGARPDYAIEVPGSMTPDGAETLRRSWVERHSGQSTDKAPVVLAGGMKLHQLTMSSEDSQLIASRSFQVEEICRVFGVPPWMVGHTANTTSWGSGVEQMGIGFVKYTMQRHLVAFEQEINYKLFKTARNFTEFLTAGLERGDFKARNEAYRIALGRAGEPAWMTINEVRALENLPPVAGGDELFEAEAHEHGAAPEEAPQMDEETPENEGNDDEEQASKASS
jgi:HK97 family phage portal protein